MNPSPSLGRDEAANPVLDELIAEITDKLQAGEAVDVETYAAAHPEVAAELRRLLPALELLAVVGSRPGSEAASQGEHREPPLHGELGDFRILREVGRGGMGIVYEAEQLSLRRRVALKVLPFAATMDPRHLQRFHNEAQAAACLHHTNIVPVFFVGCERGVHFYAMQFIDGQTLSDLIRQLRGREKTATKPAGVEQTAAYQPAPTAVTPPPAVEMTPLTGEGKRGRDYYRKVAELGVQAAEALDHAHQLGIVHRDIKPGNLLLDGRGNLWVTDFGLAHIQQSEANLTVTGQALGTPRYMSPEQALAKRVPIDHRTDVYSLGATLYELLTLRSAFESEDRQELLRQIAFDDPAKPRRRERAIPAELEIIVLKAMEKRPQDRYATAQELADDLRRWLKNEPIRARRPGMIQRAVKWGRRHRPLVVAAVVCLFLALVMLAISNVVIWREHEETKEALLKARIHEQEVSILVDRAVRTREEIEVKLQRSLEVMDRTLTALEEPFPEEGTESARINKAVSEQALKFYQDVLPIETRRLSLLWETMWAYVRLGNLYALHNQFDEARQAYSKVQSTAKELWNSRNSMVPSTRAFEPRDRPAIEKAYHRALTHWRKISPKGLSGVEDYRITIQATLSGWHKIGEGNKWEQPDTTIFWKSMSRWERIRVLERIVEDLPAVGYVSELVGLWSQHGNDLHQAGRVEEAKAAYRRAVKNAEKGTCNIPSQGPAQVNGLLHLASNLLSLGCALDYLGMSGDAESAIRLSLAFDEQRVDAPSFYLGHNIKRLVDQDGKLLALLSGQRRPADNAERLDLAWMSKGCQRYVAAVRLYSEAFSAEPKVADDLTALHRYHAACAAAYAGCGQGANADKLGTEDRVRLCQQARDWLRTELKAYRQLMEKSPDKARPEIRGRLVHLLVDDHLPGVRHAADLNYLLEPLRPRIEELTLGKLTETERREWEKLWQEVEALWQQEFAANTKPPTAVDQPNRKEGSPGKD